MHAVPNHGKEAKQPALAKLFLAMAIGWAILWFVHAWHYWEDDAWIHLEFARSLVRGRGFSFNGQIVYGDTSPLWVWLLVATHTVFRDWWIAGKVLTVLAATFTLSGVFAFAQKLLPHHSGPEKRVFAALMVLILVVNPYYGYWAYSGMEALGAAGLVCWGLVAIHGSSSNRPISVSRYLLACFLAGIAPLLRPEMLFFTGLLGLVLFLRWVNLPAKTTRKLRLFFGGLALVMGPGIAWATYAARTFGSILPNTNAAKRAGPDESVLPHLAQLYVFGFPLAVLGLLLLLFWAVYGRRLPGAISGVALASSLDTSGWLLFFWTALNCCFYVVNHTYVQTRYIFVTAPLLTLALFAIARQLQPKLYSVGVALGITFGVSVSLLATWPLIRNKVQIDRDYASMASYLRTLPAQEPVAHYSIGEAAFLSEHPIIDLGGITRPGVIPFLWDASDNRRVWWAHEQGARYMVLDHSPEPGSVLVWSRAIPTTGWYLNPRRYRAKELLLVWKLPLSPTLPLPADMPSQDPP